MKMSKNTIFVCFALCLLFHLGGCSLFSESSRNTTKDSKTSEDQVNEGDSDKEAAFELAETKLQDAKGNLAKLETSLKADKGKIEAEKVSYDKMVAESKKSGKDFNNPDSDTYKQGKKADKLQEEYNSKLKPLQDEVSKAQSELNKLKLPRPSLTLTPPGGGDKNFNLSDWLLPLLIGLAGLLLIGAIIFPLYQIWKTVKHERAATQEGFRSFGAKQSDLRQDVDQLKTTAELLSKQLSEQRGEIAALKRRAQGRDNFSAEPPPEPPTFAPSFPPPVPEFPVSVENYLAKNAGSAAFGKHDPLFGTLKENNDDGAFYLVRDGVLSDDARYAVPRAKQFVTKDDFVYHYSNYYVCANPTGGEVWIKKPSTVRRTADGWKLDATGELEIR